MKMRKISRITTTVMCIVVAITVVVKHHIGQPDGLPPQHATKLIIPSRSTIDHQNSLPSTSIQDLVKKYAGADFRSDQLCKLPNFKIPDNVISDANADAIQVIENDIHAWVDKGRLYFYLKEPAKYDAVWVAWRYKYIIIHGADEKKMAESREEWCEDWQPIANGTLLSSENDFGIKLSCGNSCAEHHLLTIPHVPSWMARSNEHEKDETATDRYTPHSDLLAKNNISVVILLIDNISRQVFHKFHPKTSNLFEENGAIDFKHLNTVGDGTTAQIMAFLSGKYEPEFAESRRGFDNASPLPAKKMIWHNLRQLGYVTSYSLSSWSSSTFYYRLLGFDHVPTDLFYRPYFKLTKDVKQNDRTLMDGQLSLLRQVCEAPFKMHHYTHLDLYHVVTPSNTEYVDERLFHFFSSDLFKSCRNRTLFLLGSDHGNRMSSFRHTLEGRLDERTPLLYMLPPPSLAHSATFKNLTFNANHRLVSWFDLFHTFRSLIGLSAFKESWGENLAAEQLPTRGCFRAGILENHWCTCSKSTPLPANNSLAITAAQFVIDQINTKFLADFREKCMRLRMDCVVRAAQVDIPLAVKAFDKTVGGHGYKPSFSSADAAKDDAIIEVVFKSLPNGGVYEAQVVRQKKEFSVSQGAVQRLNIYGDQPKCIATQMPSLRPFCYCRN